VLLFMLTKGKLLLFGMTKWSTVLSMALSLGVYFTLWGFWFALGFVLSLYVHEMGHVFALRRLGIAASAPMFIPGVGAFVRMKQYPATPSEDAEVGLAGPVFGLAAGFACLGLFMATNEPIFAALARTGGWLNLFNLMPLLSLDGGRGFRALDLRQRWLATAAIGLAWVLTHEHMLMIVGLVAVGNAALASRAKGTLPATGDKRAFYTYLVLIAALAWLSTTHVPINHPEGAAVIGGMR
jgi:Zn-dependent protease